MQYTLLTNFFMPSGSFEGNPGSDSHGNYILFPIEIYGVISVSDFLKTQSGELIQIYEQDYQVIDGVRYLKLYY